MNLTTKLTGTLAGLALLAAPLLGATAANAATPTLSSDANKIAITFQGGYTYNNATITASNKKPVTLFTTPYGNEYGATTYKVNIKSKGKTVYSATLKTWQAINLTLVLLKHDGSSATLYSTEKAALAGVKAAATLSTTKAKQAYAAAIAGVKRDGEDQAYKNGKITELQTWLTANPSATSFSGFTTHGTVAGRTWTISGNPTKWLYTLTDNTAKTSYLYYSSTAETRKGSGYVYGTQLPGDLLADQIGYYAVAQGS